MNNLLIALISLAFSLSASAELIVSDVVGSTTPERSGLYQHKRIHQDLRDVVAKQGRQSRSNSFCGIVYQRKDGEKVGVWFWKEENALLWDGLYAKGYAVEQANPTFLKDILPQSLNDSVSRAECAEMLASGVASCLGTQNFILEDLEETQADCVKNGTTYTIKPFKPEQD